MGRGHRHSPRGKMCVTRSLFNSNNFATSAALAKLCALLSAIRHSSSFKIVLVAAFVGLERH